MGRKTATISEEYFSWLYKRVVRLRPSYIKLCRELHAKKFRWFVHNDDNRCSDGIELRDLFIEENNLDEKHLEIRSFLKADCSVFEVLVALAQRMNDLMYDLNNTQKDRSPQFFYDMVENLGFIRFTDNYSRFDGKGFPMDTRFDPVTEAEINEALEIFLDRTYGADGRGGLFPLKKRHKLDQSTVEIWYQMMTWMDENYG